jgi:hypothetical protein
MLVGVIYARFSGELQRDESMDEPVEIATCTYI